MKRKFNIVSDAFKSEVANDLSSIYVKVDSESDVGVHKILKYFLDGLEKVFNESGCADSIKYFLRYTLIGADDIMFKLGIAKLRCTDEVKDYICKHVIYLVNSAVKEEKYSISVSAILMYADEEFKFTYAYSDVDYKDTKDAWIRAYAEYVLSMYDDYKIKMLRSRLRSFVVKRLKAHILRRLRMELDFNSYHERLMCLDWAYRLYRYIEEGHYVDEPIHCGAMRLVPEVVKWNNSIKGECNE